MPIWYATFAPLGHFSIGVPGCRSGHYRDALRLLSWPRPFFEFCAGALGDRYHWVTSAAGHLISPPQLFTSSVGSGGYQILGETAAPLRSWLASSSFRHFSEGPAGVNVDQPQRLRCHFSTSMLGCSRAGLSWAPSCSLESKQLD
jgi:hypothetical protein